MVVPRLARKLGAFALDNLPEQMDTFVATFRSGGSVIAEATAGDMANHTISNTTVASIQSTSSAVAQAAASAIYPDVEQTGFMSYFTPPFTLDSIRGFGGIFAYLGSRWALTTFALV